MLRKANRVSIPQAVSTIATGLTISELMINSGFNTASGKYYCNDDSNVVTLTVEYYGFNTASGKYYCNS